MEASYLQIEVRTGKFNIPRCLAPYYNLKEIIMDKES